MCGILKETCKAILMPEYVRAPGSMLEWEGASNQFERISHIVLVSLTSYHLNLNSKAIVLQVL